MNKPLAVSLLLGTLMLSSAAVTRVMTPTVHLSEVRAPLDLEHTIPTRFGEWEEEKNTGAMVINPETERELAKIYTQTLSRTYVNRAGERVMLSIAYGADQTSGLQLHYPEVCYPAQGFNLYSAVKGTLQTSFGPLAVKRLSTALGARREPVTYWTTMAEKVVLGGYDTKLAQLSYGFRGEIPDGLIFRVSSLGSDTGGAFALQERFVRQIVDALPAQARARFIGLPG
ncbi:EpsI family protein [Oxalobacteraceae bacterium]|nr:EpsI family protein [Oxalobacteraceae bacterium]